MRTIWKFPLPEFRQEQFALDMPAGAVVLDVQMQHDELRHGIHHPVLWAEVNDENPTTKRQFLVAATGSRLPVEAGIQYVGTFQAGPNVFHLYAGGEI